MGIISMRKNIEKTLSGRPFQIFGNFLTLSFFVLIIITPIIFIFSFIILEWSSVYQNIFNDPISLTAQGEPKKWLIMQTALIHSFSIAAIVTVIDLIIGLPMALILARFEFKGKKYVDTLVDLPLAVPSSALGFSIFLFWGTRNGISFLLGLETGLFSLGPMMIVLAHVAFTYSFVVRSLKAIIEGVDTTYEDAARSLGAPSFTVFRKITGPLSKGGIIAGTILCFTRSLGETGATLIVAGTYEMSSVTVVSLRKSLAIGQCAFLSAILVSTAILLLALLRFMSKRIGFPIKKVWLGPESFLSGKLQRKTRDVVTYLIFSMIILIPSCFTFVYVLTWWNGSPYSGDPIYGVFYQVFQAPDRKWASIWLSLMTSLSVAFIATVVNIIAGLPMAIIMVRKPWGKIKDILDALIDIPLAIPTSALGFSLFLFWGSKGINLVKPGFFLIVIVHIVFTYPYAVRPLIAILEGIDIGLEEASRTLGAPSFTTFRKITLPLISKGILAAGIMTFTRSLGETGATIVVMGTARTIPVFIVELVESLSLQSAAFASVILILISFVLLLALRYVTKGLGFE